MTVWSVDSWILFNKFINWLHIVIISFYVMSDHPRTWFFFFSKLFFGGHLMPLLGSGSGEMTGNERKRESCNKGAWPDMDWGRCGFKVSALSPHPQGRPHVCFLFQTPAVYLQRRPHAGAGEQLNRRLQKLRLQREVKFVMTYG